MKWYWIWLFVIFSSPVLAARETQSFDEGWFFAKLDIPRAAARDFADEDWEQVALPHTWNAEDAQSPNYFRGVGWYRKHFTLKPSSRRVFVKFEAANLVAEVFLNGTSLGVHQGGYTAFSFLLPNRLLRDQNVIAVKVDNAANADVPPLQADYTFFGGLYRHAWLISTDQSHFSLDDGAAGVWVSTTELSSESAQVEIRSAVANDAPSEITLTQTVSWGDDSDPVSKTITVGANQTLRTAQSISIPSPHLWQGVSDPYLYRARVTLQDKNGALVDEVSVPFGLRTVKIDPNRGVILNGRPVELRGVSLHQDWKGLGWAISDRERTENIEILRELGANAIRLSHYPRSEDELDLLDRQGIMAWSENPLINLITASDTFQKNTKTQLREMIRQRSNHPSIFFWGLFNEVHEDPVGLISQLNTVAHLEDSTRPTTAASNLTPRDVINTSTDLISFNMYFGWYPASPAGKPGFGGESSQFGQAIDQAHEVFSAHPVGLSEYGAGAGPGQHQLPPVRPRTTSRFHPEEWQALVHESYYQQLAKRRFIFGHFIWNLVDFASPARKEGAELGLNDKGLVSYDRKYKKQAYYFYRAHWNPKPMVYLTSKGASVKAGTPFTVKAYSNQTTVELFIDESSRGKSTAHDGVIFEWNAISLAAGAHVFEVRAGEDLSDRGEMSLED